MNAEIAARIAATVREAPLIPAAAAQMFVERMGDDPTAVSSTFPVRLDRRRESVSAAIRLVALNAEMAETIRGVLQRSALPVPGNTHDVGFHDRVRTALQASIVAVLPTPPSDDDEVAAWHEIGAIVAGSLFGASLAQAA